MLEVEWDVYNQCPQKIRALFFLYIHVHVLACAHMRAHAHTRTHAHTHTCTHTHAHRIWELKPVLFWKDCQNNAFCVLFFWGGYLSHIRKLENNSLILKFWLNTIIYLYEQKGEFWMRLLSDNFPYEDCVSLSEQFCQVLDLWRFMLVLMWKQCLQHPYDIIQFACGSAILK